MSDSFPQHPHPSDVTAAETQIMRRRLGLGIAIALSLNLLFLTGGAAIATYIEGVFHPFFFPKKDRIVFVRMDVKPSPTPKASPTAEAR